MILLQRDRAAVSARFRGAGLQKLLVRLLDGYYEFDGDIPFNTQKGKYQVWKEAKPSIQAESSGKCAYCESLTSVVAYGDVEHFRPKDLYWWLAFSYDNYTYACQLCNQKFKGANFPVSGRRAKPPVNLPKTPPPPAQLASLASKLSPDPGNDSSDALRAYFRQEKAHLPHPYLDDPERLFSWQVDDVNREVLLVARGTRVAARRAVLAAEQFLGLNRQELRRARYAHYSLIQALLLVLQESESPGVRSAVLRQLVSAAGADQPYAAMTRHFLREWNVLN